MPKYVYKCPDHGPTEVIMRLKDAGKPTNCCAAGCTRVMKQIFQPPAIIIH